MLTATLTSKGQLTLPKPIRDLFHLERGSTVIFTLNEQEAVLRPLSKKVDDVFGCLKRKQQTPVTVEAMKEGVRQRARKAFPS
ncbi:MAG: AbrB/MazE/SpoVT family DNA-binding domain-containing protein [bacterium]